MLHLCLHYELGKHTQNTPVVAHVFLHGLPDMLLAAATSVFCDQEGLDDFGQVDRKSILYNHNEGNFFVLSTVVCSCFQKVQANSDGCQSQSTG